MNIRSVFSKIQLCSLKVGDIRKYEDSVDHTYEIKEFFEERSSCLVEILGPGTEIEMSTWPVNIISKDELVAL